MPTKTSQPRPALDSGPLPVEGRAEAASTAVGRAAWTPATWADALEASPFGEVATYDGRKGGQWPRVEPTATGSLLWHELARR